MDPSVREDVKQTLMDQCLVERLEDGHWAREILIFLIQFGVHRIGYYKKQHFLTVRQYIRIRKEAEAPYAAERQKTAGDKRLPHCEGERGDQAERQPSVVRDQVKGVYRSHTGLLVQRRIHRR